MQKIPILRFLRAPSVGPMKSGIMTAVPYLNVEE